MMTRHEQLAILTAWFLHEKTGAAGRLGISEETIENFVSLDLSDDNLFHLYRSLVNVRPAHAVPDDIANLQNEFLRSEIASKGITDAMDLPGRPANGDQESGPLIALWQGDITTLKVDAIVNAANSALLGCWAPCHACIDNAIHTFAGTQLRLACQAIMDAQGHEEETGSAKITPAFSLPSKYVLHTVGPIVRGKLTALDEELLARCYRSCLELAERSKLESIAFCCISTGEFHFPNRRAAEIAVGTVRSYAEERSSASIKKIVFNVFKETDHEIYKDLIE